MIWFFGFCSVAGVDELNRGGRDLGTEDDVFYLPENNWDIEGMTRLFFLRLSQQYFNNFRVIRKLLPSPPKSLQPLF